MDSKYSAFVLTGPIRCESSFIARVSYTGGTYFVEELLVIGTSPPQTSLGWRDGEVYPASLVIPQRPGVTQGGFRQMVHPEKSVEGNSSEKMLTKNGVMSEGSL